MFNDAKQELERLQEELLAEEKTAPVQQDDDLLSDQILDQLLDMDYRSYNADKTDVDPQELAQELSRPTSSLTGLIVTAGLLTLGIFLVICWWLIRYMGKL